VIAAAGLSPVFAKGLSLLLVFGPAREGRPGR